MSPPSPSLLKVMSSLSSLVSATSRCCCAGTPVTNSSSPFNSRTVQQRSAAMVHMAPPTVLIRRSRIMASISKRGHRPPRLGKHASSNFSRSQSLHMSKSHLRQLQVREPGGKNLPQMSQLYCARGVTNLDNKWPEEHRARNGSKSPG